MPIYLAQVVMNGVRIKGYDQSVSLYFPCTPRPFTFTQIDR